MITNLPICLIGVSTGTTFTEPQVWTHKYGYDAGWRYEKHIRTLEDVNEDGMADIVAFGYDGVYVSLSRGHDFAGPAKWVSFFGYDAGDWRKEEDVRILSDVNGDGKVDIVGFNDSGVYVSLTEENRFSEPVMWTKAFRNEEYSWTVDRHIRTMGDVNNDGKLDIVGFGDIGVFVSLFEAQ